jgi:hypothetical protein
MRHQLIRIGALIHLTTGELRELDARLRHILERDTNLTDRDIAIILASLENVQAALACRLPLGLRGS